LLEILGIITVHGGWVMTQSRKTELSQHLLVDDLTQLTGDMIDYVANFPNKMALLELAKNIRGGYRYLYGSWLLGKASKITGFRVRDVDLDGLIAAISQSCTSLELLDAVAAFFKKGDWKTTSTNTSLLHGIIAKLPAFKASDTPPDDSLDHRNIRARLGELFVTKAKSYKLTERFVLNKQSHSKDELKALTSSMMSKPAEEKMSVKREQFEVFLKSRLIGAPPAKFKAMNMPGKLNQAIVNKVREKLDDILLQQSANTAKFTTKPRVFVQEQPFEEMDMTISMAPPAPPPPPIAVKVAVAPVASSEIIKSECNLYEAPPRKRLALSDTQLTTLVGFYAARSADMKAVEQKVAAPVVRVN
jgi:hypothetical protein